MPSHAGLEHCTRNRVRRVAIWGVARGLRRWRLAVRAVIVVVALVVLSGQASAQYDEEQLSDSDIEATAKEFRVRIARLDLSPSASRFAWLFFQTIRRPKSDSHGNA